MKAISLWQPWASAMADGLKRNETRSWPTRYRGDLVICSAKRNHHLRVLPDERVGKYGPFGCALCVVDVWDCVTTEQIVTSDSPIMLDEIEKSLGDYTPGRWAWLTRNLRMLKTPVPVIGRQGLFNLPTDVAAAIQDQL